MGKQSSEDAIRVRAYHLWEDAGRPAGRADEYWEMARALVEAERESGVTDPAHATDAPVKRAVRKKTTAVDGSATTAKPSDRKATEDSAPAKPAKSTKSASAATKPATKKAAKTAKDPAAAAGPKEAGKAAQKTAARAKKAKAE